MIKNKYLEESAEENASSKITCHKSKATWTKEEDELLYDLRKKRQLSTWNEVSSYFANKSAKQCAYRYSRVYPELSSRQRKWTKEEDLKLVELIDIFGENFFLMKKYFPNKTEKEIQQRFYKKINPDKIHFSNKEDEALIRLYENKPLTNEEKRALKRKGNYALKKRLDLLLKLKGEERNKSLNLSSYFSSLSNTINDNSLELSKNHSGYSLKEVTVKEENKKRKQIKTVEEGKKIYKTDNLNNTKISNFTFRDQECSNSNILNENTEKLFIDNSLFKPQQFNKNFDNFNNIDRLNNENDFNLENNNFNENTFMDIDDKPLFPLDDLCLIEPNKDEEFEKSFNDVFNASSAVKTDFYLDFKNDLDFDQLLNEYSDPILNDFLQKKKNLEAILSKIHNVSDSFYLEFKLKMEKLSISNKRKVFLLRSYNSLVQEEKQLLAKMNKIKTASYGINLTGNPWNSFNIKDELNARIDILIKLIQINKQKIQVTQDVLINS